MKLKDHAETAWLFERNGLEHLQQHQNDNNQQNQPKTAARVRSPIAAVGPCRNRSNQKKNQDDQNYCCHGFTPSNGTGGASAVTRDVMIFLPDELALPENRASHDDAVVGAFSHLLPSQMLH